MEAVIGLVTGVYHLSRRVSASLMSDILGVDISLGAVSAVEERVSEATKPPVDEARAKTEEAVTKHTDGTTSCQAGALWTITTSAVTVFKILTDGKAATLAPLSGSKLGILVSDRAAALNFWVMQRRQACWAHLLRKAISFSERGGPSGAIGRELLDSITIIFGRWHALKDGTLTRAAFGEWMAPVRLHIEALLERAVQSRLPHGPPRRLEVHHRPLQRSPLSADARGRRRPRLAGAGLHRLEQPLGQLADLVACTAHLQRSASRTPSRSRPQPERLLQRRLHRNLLLAQVLAHDSRDLRLQRLAFGPSPGHSPEVTRRPGPQPHP